MGTEEKLMSQLDDHTKQLLTEARKRAISHLRDPLAAFFAGELVSNANPVDSLLGLTSCVTGAVATTVKVLSLQHETSSNEELAEILGDAFKKSLLAALNATDKQINERIS